MTPEALAAEGPRCARHADAAAVGTCARCGSFACESCVAEREPAILCAACVALRDQASLGEPFSIGGSLGRGWALFAGALWPIAFFSFIVCLPEAAVIAMGVSYRFGSSPALNDLCLGTFLNLTFGIVGNNAMYVAVNDAVQGRAPTFGRALARGLRLWLRVFTVSFEMSVRVGLLLILLVVPGIVEAVSLCVAVPAAIVEANPRAIWRSRELTEGHRWSLLALMAVLVFAPIAFDGLGNVALRFTGVRMMHWGWVASLAERSLTKLCGAYVIASTLAAYYGLRRSRQLLDSR